MNIRWYVIDADENLTSYDTKKDKQEDFPSRTAALKRATELARDEPRKAFYICQTTDVITVETKPANRTILVR